MARRGQPLRLGQRWEASDIPLVVGTVVVTRIVRVAIECLARELAEETMGTLVRSRGPRRERAGWDRARS